MMSLVAYENSDESDEEFNSDESNEKSDAVTNNIVDTTINVKEDLSTNCNSSLKLPAPKNETIVRDFEQNEDEVDEKVDGLLGLKSLPKPVSFQHDDIPEDDDIPLFQPKLPIVEKPVKKDRVPARISIPSLSEFKDVDEDLERSKIRPEASKKGTGLFAVLPPPKSEIATKRNNLIPTAVKKSTSNLVPDKVVTKTVKINEGKVSVRKAEEMPTNKKLPLMDYDSNSEEDDEEQDFFSLSKPTTLPEVTASSSTNFFGIPEKEEFEDAVMTKETMINKSDDLKTDAMEVDQRSSTTLVSTVMNLPREEILLKNKAEVGPKLPVPEQEFNIDSEGNVAFDDKAIEYLCGKRGVKRKNQVMEEANIIDINGEDIKPDEREWLVKALTEEPVQRPVSMQGTGPSSQSKKKHQITYLAHQAKAMEIELKNTWSQNRMARKQTQSKYGF